MFNVDTITREEMIAAFEGGYRDRITGQPNPYPEHSAAGITWEHGWRYCDLSLALVDAQRQILPSKN